MGFVNANAIQSRKAELWSHLDDVLHEGLVGGHLGLLHDGNGGPDPRDKHELAPLAHLVTGLEKKDIGKSGGQHSKMVCILASGPSSNSRFSSSRWIF